MTKQEIINILNSSELEAKDKETFLAIIANEEDPISMEAQAQIIDAISDIVKGMAESDGIILEESDEVKKIDEEFQKELDEAEKLLSTLDIAERDLDIAYAANKA